MSNDSTATQSSDAASKASPLAQVFQEAYQKAVLIRRLDEQMAQIAGRRRQLCDELRTIQSQLNDEFGKLVETGAGAVAGFIPGASAGDAIPHVISVPQPDFASGNGNGNGVRVSVNAKAFGQRVDEHAAAVA